MAGSFGFTLVLQMPRPSSNTHEYKKGSKPSHIAAKDDEANVRTTLIVVRHGETVAEVFPQWLRLAYQGRLYQPFDLNMPSTIPDRPMEHFRFDPPLSQFGYSVAERVGKGIRQAGYDPHTVSFIATVYGTQAVMSRI
ncbi:hypothetical protein TELCIR_01987 [Teladorsagia circumcincta]|uniref:Phosphoglycerate mutase family protein n=1 Tax=Teladorsagia circumcincta TaxID=45464 RepID=A0A2G9V0C4_TELCI|nr:hypothetical protein TELCIR_01987 [Teladorsagia circumcincta]